MDPERTLSKPSVDAALAQSSATVLTIAWHPERARIGEHAVLLPERDGGVELMRYAPEFRRPGAIEGLPLGHRGVSRQPLRLRVHGDGAVDLVEVPASMDVHADGVAVAGALHWPAAQVAAGVTLRLGERVLLVLSRQTGLPDHGYDGGLLGVSSAIVRVRNDIRRAARTDLPVLLTGESGTGKELAAQALHRLSRRHAGPLVSTNMAALGESLAAAELFGAQKGAYTGAQSSRRGLFAEAHQGSLFLDEIGDTAPVVQPMLLRTLESGEYRPLGASRNERADVRLIAATDRPLGAGFNQPLLRRLDAFRIALPPLRERREDIGLIVAATLASAESSPDTGSDFDAALVDALTRGDWPGNVRQLIHAVQRLALTPVAERSAVLAGIANAASAVVVDRRASKPASAASPSAPAAPAAANVRRHRDPSTIDDAALAVAFAASDWCVRRAAETLGISRTSLYALLDRSTAVRRVDDLTDTEIREAVRAAPDDPSRWAERLRTPREPLRRRVRAMGLDPA